MNHHSQETGKPAFVEVYERYYDRIYKYAYTLLLNREDAEVLIEKNGFFAELVERQRLDTATA